MEYHKGDLNLEQNWTVVGANEETQRLELCLNFMFSTDNLEPNELVICDPNVLLESIYQLVAVSFGGSR